MVKTLRLSFSLKVTYRVNSILYFIRQIPLIGKWIPESIYHQKWIKILAEVTALLWELMTAFAGKLLFLFLLVFLPARIYESLETDAVFTHLFVLLTLAGRDNNYLTGTDRSCYYSVLLLGMDAKAYTLLRFGYGMAKLLVGYLTLGLLFGRLSGVPVVLCLLMPLFAAGVKCASGARQLRKFSRRGDLEEEKAEKILSPVLLTLLLAAAYGLPFLGVVIPAWAAGAVMVLGALAGAASLKTLRDFPEYRSLHQVLWTQFQQDMTNAMSTAVKTSRKTISEDTNITSKRRGFAYLNDLFVKRHKKVMWKPALITAGAAGGITAAALVGIWTVPELGADLNGSLMGLLPAFAFIMYLVNRGTSYTQTLYVNCDHSLLTYSFFKRPNMILKLFCIRLVEIVKVNLVPGSVIALALPVLLAASGGTENPLDYVVLPVTVISMNIFFSVHYLTMYYLLQPYNAGSELKNGAYQFVSGATYFVCYLLTQIELPGLLFGGICIAFCAAYCVAAGVLVYFLAPKTFRIRA